MLNQLKNCEKDHFQCNRSTVTLLPKRVLDISNAEVKLHEADVLETGRYACLSHCRGNSKSIKTTVGSLSAMKVGIPWSSLPKTFQDAITFTRRLWIQYLWIDSLCIIQDDRKDWHSEAAKMADVYQNSFLTVAATRADNDASGCFPESSNFINDYHLEGVMNDYRQGPYRVYVRRTIPHLEVKVDEAQREEYPLLRRGWVYQERLLSPRVLHFCNQEFW